MAPPSLKKIRTVPSAPETANHAPLAASKTLNPPPTQPDRMNYEQFYSNTAANLSPIAIREVADRIAGRDVISFGAGWPNEATFPADAVADLAERALADRAGEALQYGTTQGDPELRQQVARRLRERHGADVTAENVLITAGSQQGLYLAARAFLDPGEEVAVGAPTYVAALTAFDRVASPQYVTVPVDEDGLQVEVLAERLESTDPAFVYTVPTFQNPSGATTTAARREHLADLAREHDVVIVEDQPYDALRYEGDPVDPHLSLAPEHTVHLGTFSKVLAPGFRLGWAVAPEPVIRKLKLLKQPVDLMTGVFAQHVAREYLATGRIDEQLADTRALYRDKRDLMLAALDEEMPAGVEWNRPEGGMFLWLTFAEGVDGSELLEDALDEGVAFIPGEPFYAGDPARNTARLNFTYVDDDELREGVRRLARAVEAHGE